MGREEFLGQLREALDGKVSEQIISDNVGYYSSYISSQVAGGRSESEVLGMLGDPRLLAKTIAESSKFASGRAQESSGIDDGPGRSVKKNDLISWLAVGIMIIAVVVAFVIAYRTLMIFAPVILLAAAAYFVYNMIRK